MVAVANDSSVALKIKNVSLRMNGGDRLAIHATVASTIDDVEFRWLSSCTGCNRDSENVLNASWSETSMMMYTPGSADLPLVLPGGTLQGGATYSFRLTASKLMVEYSARDISIEVNAGPSSAAGFIQVSPSSGMALATVFEIETGGWTDIDLPLQYQFLWWTCGDSTARWLTSRIANRSVAGMVLPSSRNLVIAVKAFDAFQASTILASERPMYVVEYAPPSHIGTREVVAGFLADHLDLNKRHQTIQALSVYVSGNGTCCNNSENAAAREMLVEQLAIAMTPDTTILTLHSLQLVTEPHRQVNNRSVHMSLDVLDRCCTFSSAAVAVATEPIVMMNILSSLLQASMVNAEIAPASSQNEIEASQKQATGLDIGHRISRVLAQVARFLSSDMLVHERHRTVSTATMTLEVYKRMAAQFENTSLGANGGVIIPDGTFAEHRGTVLTAQLTRWTGAGPYFAAAAGQSFTGASAELGSGVLSVSFLSAEPAYSEVKINNLDPPLELHFALVGKSLNLAADRPKTTMVHCAHWDSIGSVWSADGLLAHFNTSRGSIGCHFTHLTDFAAFVGPAPQFNKLTVVDLYELYYQNPIGFIVSLSFLLLTCSLSGIGRCHYRRMARATTEQDGDSREAYDRKAANFVRQQLLLDDPSVPWTTKALVKLRTGWLFGASFCTIQGDPFLSSQRFFVIMLQILVSMALTCMFFSEGSRAECEQACLADDPRNVYEDEESASWAADCVDKCADEVFLDNGLQASLIAAALAVPIVGLLNFGFGWLRRPLNADLQTKSGETLAQLMAKETEEKQKTEDSQPKLAQQQPPPQQQHLEHKGREYEAHTGANEQHVDESVQRPAQSVAEEEQEDAVDSTRSGLKPQFDVKDANNPNHHKLKLFDASFDMDDHVLKKGVVRSRRTHACDLCKHRGNNRTQSAACLRRCLRNTFVSKPLECINCIVVQAKCGRKSCESMLRGIRWFSYVVFCSCCCRRKETSMYHFARTKPAVAPRGRAKVGQRRQAVALQMVTLRESAEILFERFDSDETGFLEREQLRQLMIEINGGLPVSDFALDFVSKQSTAGYVDQRVSKRQVGEAVSLWRYLQHEQAYIEQRFDQFDSDHDLQLGEDELKAFLTSLNDDIPVTTKEAQWVITQTDTDNSGGLDTDELRAAVALWYPTVYNRRKVDDLARGMMTGRKRKAMAAQLTLHHHQVELRFKEFDSNHDGVLNVEELHALMLELNDGKPISDWAVEFVLLTADCQENSICRDDVVPALARWRVLLSQQGLLEQVLDRYDKECSGKLSRSQVKDVLTELNEGIPVSNMETDWVIEASDIDGSGELSRTELRATVAMWYFHLVATTINPRKGFGAEWPWCYSSAAGIACALMVAWYSVNWSQEKTVAWLETTGLSLIWKLFVFDPLKSLFCGPVLEPIATFLCGGGAGDIALNTVLEDLDGRIEELGEQFADMLVDGGEWGQDKASADQEAARRKQLNAVFAMGGYTTSKWRSKKAAVQMRVHLRTLASEHEQLQAHERAAMAHVNMQRSKSQSRYARKVRKKRILRGLSSGSFGRRGLVAEISTVRCVSDWLAHHESEPHVQVTHRLLKAQHEEEVAEYDGRIQAEKAKSSSKLQTIKMKKQNNQRTQVLKEQLRHHPTLKGVTKAAHELGQEAEDELDAFVGDLAKVESKFTGAVRRELERGRQAVATATSMGDDVETQPPGVAATTTATQQSPQS
eukprot:SAG31_NODE_1420_length_8429_cov_32.568547_2_plen_1718_part_00